jgi:SulP family sulfate permease
MILLPRVHKRIPAALVGLVVATCAAIGFGGSYEAIGALPQSLPAPVLPSFAGLDWPRFLPSALALAFLASLGSLLATSSLDALHPARQASDLDQDLVAHGLANIVAGLFGGFPVMGAIVRAGASVQMGARTRAASMSHALWLLVAMMALAPWVARIPVPALTAILLVVAGRLLNLEGLVAMFKEAKSVFAIVVVTAVTIAAFGFIVGIAAGIFLAAGLYVHRHGALRLDLLRDGDTLTHARVHGPLLFINHMKLYTLIEGSSWSKLTAIDLSRTSYVDAAGVQTLAYLAEFLAIRGSKLVLVGVPGHLHERLEDVVPHLLGGRLHADVDDALVSAGLRTPPALPEVRPAPQRPERRSLTA